MKRILPISFLILLSAVFWNHEVQAPEAAHLPPLPEPKITTLLAVGDIMLSRNVSTKIEQANNPDLPFEAVREQLRSADIAFGNLECPLSDSEIRIREGLVFRCLVKDFAGVINSGFDVLSTANNHSFDQGSDNIDFTVDYLNSKKILPIGTFKFDSNTSTLNVIERNGTNFGFLAYSYSARNDGRFSTDPQVATMDIERLKLDVEELKTIADVIIVSMHAGAEYRRHPNPMQTEFAHAAIDAGADIVIGHHPHWIQDVEIYNGKPIFYSLGNFVFDQMWSEETREGLAVRLNFHGKKLDSAELIPVIIDDYCCPRPANEHESQNILQKINSPAVINLIDNRP